MTVIRPNSISGVTSITAQVSDITIFGASSGFANITAGNISAAGTITYEDVTNVDSIGILTARSGIKIGPIAGVAATIFSDGSINTTGIVTATSFSGSGANLTGISQVGGSTGVDFNDNVKIRLGTGNDIQIYHESGQSYIQNSTGNFRIDADALRLRSKTGGESFITANVNGAVEIFHDNDKKFMTQSDGVRIEDGGLLYFANDSENSSSYIQNSDSSSNANLNFYTREGGSGAIRWRITKSGQFIPHVNNTYDIGDTSNRVRNIYTNDLNLSNEGSTNSVDNTWGNYTIQEGESDLFLINNRNGKKYKFNLTEVS